MGDDNSHRNTTNGESSISSLKSQLNANSNSISKAFLHEIVHDKVAPKVQESLPREGDESAEPLAFGRLENPVHSQSTEITGEGGQMPPGTPGEFGKEHEAVHESNMGRTNIASSDQPPSPSEILILTVGKVQQREVSESQGEVATTDNVRKSSSKSDRTTESSNSTSTTDLKPSSLSTWKGRPSNGSELAAKDDTAPSESDKAEREDLRNTQQNDTTLPESVCALNAEEVANTMPVSDTHEGNATDAGGDIPTMISNGSDGADSLSHVNNPIAYAEPEDVKLPNIFNSTEVSELAASDECNAVAKEKSEARMDASGSLPTDPDGTVDSPTSLPKSPELFAAVATEADDSEQSRNHGADAADESHETAQDSAVRVSGSSMPPFVTREASSYDVVHEIEKSKKDHLVTPIVIEQPQISKQETSRIEASGRGVSKNEANEREGPMECTQAAMKSLDLPVAPGIPSLPLKCEYRVKFGRLAMGKTTMRQTVASGSSMGVFGEGKLKRVKCALYISGSKVHRGAGFERLFAEYWDAMVLRLSGTLCRHTSERCQLVIDRFLKTSKLRKLHNTFIFCIMRHASTQFASYDDLGGQVPSQWRDRIKMHPVGLSESRLDEVTPVASITRDLMESHDVLYNQAGPESGRDENSEKPRASALRAMIFPSPNVPSSSLPGALTVDILVRKLADKRNMQVSELAMWLMSVAVKEHVTQILKASISQKESIEHGYLPERRQTFPNGLAGSAQVSSNSDGSDENVAMKPKEVATTIPKEIKSITPLDLYTVSAAMPIDRRESVGGSISRSSVERYLYACYDPLCDVPDEDVFALQRFVTDQILVEGTKPKLGNSAKILSSEGQMTASTDSPVPKHQSSFAVPAPAPAVGRSLPVITTQAIPQEPITGAQSADDADKSTIRGTGRGAKDLSALMKRSTPTAAEVAVNDKPDISPAQDHPVIVEPQPMAVSESSSANSTSAERQGKGFGTKNLAAMRARATTHE